MKKGWIIQGALVAAMAAGIAAIPHAQTRSVIVTGYLSGGEEVPPSLSAASGKVQCTVTDAQITCHVDIYNLSVSVTAAHIHVGPPGLVGPTVCTVNIPGVSNDYGMDFTCTAGNLTRRDSIGINSFEDFVQSVSSGNSYFNVHTTQFPGGEARARLCPTSAKDNPFTGSAACTLPAQ